MTGRAHLVKQQRKGRHRFYRLNAAPLRAVDRWLSQYRTFWQTGLTSLKAFVESDRAATTSATRKRRKK